MVITKIVHKLEDREGSVLMESIIGISLVMIGIMGIITLLVRSSNLYNSAANNLKATYLAAEGIEVVKNVIDTSYVSNGNVWNPPSSGWYYPDYLTTVGSFSPVHNPPGPRAAQFVKLDNESGYNLSVGTDTIFRRIVNIQNNGSYLKVLSYVSWVEGGDQKQILLEDHFYDWRPKNR
jgi:hypothetical protein